MSIFYYATVRDYQNDLHKIQILMFAPITLGSADHRFIWAQAQPFPGSAGCTCLFSFVRLSIT